MLFSLIIGTLNRSKELKICLDSLDKQTYMKFEVIIIDQSEDNLTRDLVNEFSHMNIVYKKVQFKGLSRARNLALSLAKGDYFALIDDDAAYKENYLEIAYELLKNDPNLILSGYIWNPINNSHLADYDKAKNEEKLTFRKILRMTPSPGLIFPMKIIRESCKFDESFGVGSQFGACEETDLILQASDLGYEVLYSRKMEIAHPTIKHTFELENDSSLRKKENYAYGLGALISKDEKVRKTNRLKIIKYEKIFKIFVKTTGIFGNAKRIEAQAEWNGFSRGLKVKF